MSFKIILLAVAALIIIFIIYRHFYSEREGFAGGPNVPSTLAYDGTSGGRGPYTGPCTPDGCASSICGEVSAPCGPVRKGDDLIINPFVWPGSVYPAISQAELVSMAMPTKLNGGSAQEKFLGRKNRYISKPASCRAAGNNIDGSRLDNLSIIDFANNNIFNPGENLDLGLACQSRGTILRASPTLDKLCYSKLEEDPLIAAKFKTVEGGQRQRAEDTLFDMALNNSGSAALENGVGNCQSMDKCFPINSTVTAFYRNVPGGNPDTNIFLDPCTRDVISKGKTNGNMMNAAGSSIKFVEKV